MKNKLRCTQKQLAYYLDHQKGLTHKEIATKYGRQRIAITRALARFYANNPSLRQPKKLHLGKKVNIDIQRDYIP